MQQLKDKDGIKLKYPERSCSQCIRFPCMQNMEELKCNMAKYGCREFKDNNSSSKSRIYST